MARFSRRLLPLPLPGVEVDELLLLAGPEPLRGEDFGRSIDST